jgi:hypothetical protein
MLKLPEEHIEIAEAGKDDKWYWRRLAHLPDETVEQYEHDKQIERMKQNEMVRAEKQ